MNKQQVVDKLLHGKARVPVLAEATAFAPTNIALCKYWGKRNTELNLPVTSSLSISLADKGATVTFSVSDQDEIILNNEILSLENPFCQRLLRFLNLFRDKNVFFAIRIVSNIPIAAGLASSACGFASLVLAMNALFDWQLSSQGLSILARLGSGSASRSVYSGFVEWQRGETDEGFDSYAEQLSYVWPDFCVGLLIFDGKEKKISSREAMLRTVETSQLYKSWPQQVEQDMWQLKAALQECNFDLLGQVAEANALAMHATMLSAWPPIQYSTPETIMTMGNVWRLREDGLSLYFTQDAGPNLKLLFQQKDAQAVLRHFPQSQIVVPFS